MGIGDGRNNIQNIGGYLWGDGNREMKSEKLGVYE